MATYRAITDMPPLVQRAMKLAENFGFSKSCIPEVGRLLRLLASQFQSGTLAELGTGCGVGAAWIASALAPGTRFVTVELDEARAAAAQELFEPFANIQIIHGDWHEILKHAPFIMLFADAASAKRGAPELLLKSLQPGGLVILDDLTPENQWPPEWQGQPDMVRQFWLNDPRVAATELLVTPSSAVILATRRM